MRLRICSILLIVAVGASESASPKRWRFASCGINFGLPAGWTAALEPPDADDRSSDDHSAELCTIDLRPRNWSRIAKKSRWDASDPPLILTVFKAGTTLEKALGEAGFQNDPDDLHGYGVAGGYGSWARAKTYRFRQWRGQEADTFFRGFARDDAHLAEGESRVFSGEQPIIVVRGPAGRMLQFDCGGGTPDEPVNCYAAVEAVLRTAQFSDQRH